MVVTVPPRFTNFPTSFSFSLNFYTSLVFTVDFGFLEYIFRSILIAFCTNIDVLRCKCVVNISAISSAKSRPSNLDVNFQRFPVVTSWVEFLIIQSITKSNKTPDITQPCFTPVFTLNHPLSTPFSIAAYLLSSYISMVYGLNNNI